MDRNALLFYKGARKLGLPIHYHPDLACLEILLGRKHYYFHRTITPLNEGANIFICKNKFTANQLLLNAGFPVPKAVAFSKDDFAKVPLPDLIKTLRFPLVAKPMENSGRGVNVLCNIKNSHSLEEQINTIFKDHHYIQVEEFHQGLKEYRVLVLKNRVIGVVERFAASVTGDGVHSVEQLMAISNEKRERLSTHLTISPLIYDREYKQCLEDQGLSLKSILPKDKKIQLCHTVNTGRGGDIFSHGKKIHSQNATYLCQALKEIGLLYGGFDILCENINLPFSQTKWLIIEVNYNPDTTIHEIPNQGIKVKVIKKILWQLILRHPLSYFYHVCFRSSGSAFIKAGLTILFLLIILHALHSFP